LKNLTDLIKAELGAKSRSTDAIAEQDASLLETQLGLHHDQIDRAHDAAHDVAMAGLTQQNASEQEAQTAALQPQPDQSVPAGS